jgi:hypothetical protein
MFTVFFHGTGTYKIAILPEGQKLNSAYFTEVLLRSSAEICYPQGRGTRERRVMLHFDNAPVHNTERTGENLASFGFRRAGIRLIVRIQHHVTSFFGAMKQAFARQRFATIDDLLRSVEVFLSRLSADFLQTVFQEWIRRLQLCCECGGEYVE